MMNDRGVTAILTNFKRPENLPKILDALDAQTVKAESVVLVDNHPPEQDEFEITSEVFDRFDDVYQFDQNAGPPCRFVAAAIPSTPLLLFLDDDLMPGPKAIEFAIATGDKLDWQFATLSQVGRNYERCDKSKQLKLPRRNVKRHRTARAVDMTCRVHLVQSRFMYAAFWMRNACLLDGADEHEMRHDDIFMSQGIQHATGYHSYLIPRSDADCDLKKDLPAPHANNGRENHNVSRATLIRRCEKLGWKARV